MKNTHVEETSKTITLERERAAIHSSKQAKPNTYLHEEKSMKKKRYNIKSDP